MLKKAESEDGSMKSTARFNEQGKQVLSLIEYNEMKQETEWEYDDDGLLIKCTYSRDYDGQISEQRETCYVYENGRLVEYEQTLEYDGDSFTVRLAGEDGELEFVDISVKGDMPEYFIDEVNNMKDRLKVEYVYDEHGNLVERNTYMWDSDVLEAWEYIQVTLPRGRNAPSISDPEYFAYIR